MSLLESIVDSAIGAFDRVALRYTSFLKGYITDYCDLDTPLDQYTFATKSYSTVSFLHIKGVQTLVGTDEFIEIVHQLELLYNGLLSEPSHSFQWVFSRSPSATEAELQEYIRPLERAAKVQEFKKEIVEQLIAKRLEVLRKYIISENCILAFKTHPEALGNIERKAQEKEIKNSVKEKAFKKANLSPKFGEFAQSAAITLPRLRILHKAAIDTLLARLKDKTIGLSVELMDCHEALKHIRFSIHSKETHHNWRPVLPGDPVPYKEKAWIHNSRDNEYYPIISKQIFKHSAEVLGNIVKIGDDYYAATHVELPPQEPQRFDELFKALPNNIDWRFSITLLGGDKKFSSKIRTRHSMAQIFKITNSSNEEIENACNNLMAIRATGELLGGVRIGLTIRAKSQEEANRDLYLCARLLQAWGNCDTTFERGDPVDAVVSTLPGLDTKNTGTTFIQPIKESAILCPTTRPTSPWQDFGVNLYRTEDGKIFPIQPCSPLQHTWVNLYYARPGSGKSVLLNSQNLNLCLNPGLSKLPKISILDIGPSSQGLIQLLQELLPETRKGEAVHRVLKQDKASAINPFDTLLGMRFPHSSKMNFLKSFLLLLFTEDGETKVRTGLGELVTGLIQETYKRFCDDETPKEYEQHIEGEIDQIIAENSDWFAIPDNGSSKRKKKLTWWKIVDILAEHEFWREAGLAQRRAVPLLVDLTNILHSSQNLKDIYAKFEKDAESYNHLVKMIRSAINDYVILSHPTQFNVAEARVVALDLADVTGSSSEYNLKRAGLMYMLGREVLVGSLYFGENDIKELPELYRDYHGKKIQSTLGDIKRVCFDEFHRTAKLQAVRDQVEEDIREARKWKVEFSLSSQRHRDFTEAMIEIATNIYICNGATGKVLDEITETFDLNESQKNALKYDVHGAGSKGASFMLKCETGNGRFVQVLINSMSITELWALASTAEDVLMRKILIQKIPYFAALKLLASEFPAGSCKKQVADIATETGKTTEIIIEEFSQKLLEKYNDRREENAN